MIARRSDPDWSKPSMHPDLYARTHGAERTRTVTAVLLCGVVALVAAALAVYLMHIGKRDVQLMQAHDDAVIVKLCRDQNATPYRNLETGMPICRTRDGRMLAPMSHPLRSRFE